MPKLFDRALARLGLERRSAPSYWTGRLEWGALTPPGAATLAGMHVSPEGALALTAAYAAVNVIATDVAMLPLKVYQRRGDGGRDEVRSHPAAYRLNVTPDDRTTPMRWRQALVGHILGWGNGYSEVRFSGGELDRIDWLGPGCKADRRPQDRQLFYRLEDGSTRPPWRVVHVAGLGFDGLSGYSPVHMAREAIGLGLAAERSGAAFFGNAARPAGYLAVPQALKDEAAIKRLRAGWDDIQAGVHNHGRTAILEGGAEWRPISINPQDAQYIATREFQVIEVCRLYRVPPHKLMDFSSAALANIEASNRDYLMTTVAPWCEAIEQELNLKLFSRAERERGLFVEHHMDALMRGDPLTRYQAHEIAVRNGWRSRNDVRRIENEDPIPAEAGGDLYTIQAQVIPLDRAGAAFPDPGPTPTPAGPDGGPATP